MADLTLQLATLPNAPGAYIFRDAKGQVLYVGKAKVLRHRVRSYFRPAAILEPAKQHMVKLVAHVDTISCDTEHEALVLEASLIQQHRPPYNVVLTDDKYYLFIKITNDDLPRIYPVRRLQRDGARYFGPYSSARSVRATLQLLRRIFPHRGEPNRDADWLFPHPLFKHGTTPAAGRTIDQQQYRENVAHIIKFLEGQRRGIIERLRAGMKTASREHSFEQAALFRDQLSALERLEGSQKVYLTSRESFDTVSIASHLGLSAANVFGIREGKLLHKNTFLLKHRSVADKTDVLRQFLLQYYRVAQDIPPQILLPFSLPDAVAIAAWIPRSSTGSERPEFIEGRQPQPSFAVPERGKKKQLLTMGESNAAQLLRTEAQALSSDSRLHQASVELFKAIGITSPDQASGRRVETYDISNIQGELATGSMVVFIDGKPAKQHYKRFRIRRAATPNDYAMLQEVLMRRFSKRHEDWPLPDLVIIDGGKGQLSAAAAVLQQLSLTVPVIALAKREEEIFRLGHPKSLRLPYSSEALFLIQRMRDEAHRFTITYHRLLRGQQQRRSLLDEIPGIGPTLKRRLINHFGSLKAIRAASDDALAAIVGKPKVKVMREYL